MHLLSKTLQEQTKQQMCVKNATKVQSSSCNFEFNMARVINVLSQNLLHPSQISVDLWLKTDPQGSHFTDKTTLNDYPRYRHHAGKNVQCCYPRINI